MTAVITTVMTIVLIKVKTAVAVRRLMTTVMTVVIKGQGQIHKIDNSIDRIVDHQVEIQILDQVKIAVQTIILQP
jgi:hypothetical protein